MFYFISVVDFSKYMHILNLMPATQMLIKVLGLRFYRHVVCPSVLFGEDPVNSLNAVSSAVFGWTCLFGHDIISPFNNLEKLPTLKFVLSFLEASLHQKPHNVDMLGFNVFLQASPIVLHQNKIL